jgi:hypothetical protein
MVVNRAPPYWTLTATWMMAYIASVALLQALFHVLNRRESRLAIAVFMLAIAVLINPPGLGIQSFIDRRFQQRNLERRSRT